MEEEMISSTVTKSRGSDSSGSSSPKPKKTKHKSDFKGVVPQANGNWGAQIYANHNRTWLGTFETEEKAAKAYDSAAIKLRHDNAADKQRNYPLDAVTIHEPTFQENYTLEEVLKMIKDRSYESKFCDFIKSLEVNNGSNSSSVNSSQSDKDGYFWKELFRKELTPSDVGKLNRLVIPKKFAFQYFGEADREYTFYDKSMKDWKFRYCFWKSSSSFVFTKGWNNFVKVNHLEAKDIVVFHTCELRENSNGNEAVKQFYRIEVIGFNASEEKEGNSSRKRSMEQVEEEEAGSNDVESVKKKGKIEETVNENVNKGFKLFGVQINPNEE